MILCLIIDSMHSDTISEINSYNIRIQNYNSLHARVRSEKREIIIASGCPLKTGNARCACPMPSAAKYIKPTKNQHDYYKNCGSE